MPSPYGFQVDFADEKPQWETAEWEESQGLCRFNHSSSSPMTTASMRCCVSLFLTWVWEQRPIVPSLGCFVTLGLPTHINSLSLNSAPSECISCFLLGSWRIQGPIFLSSYAAIFSAGSKSWRNVNRPWEGLMVPSLVCRPCEHLKY